MLYWQARNKMALGFQPPMLYKSKGGGIMSDYEIIDIVTTILSLVMTAIILGCKISDKKK